MLWINEQQLHSMYGCERKKRPRRSMAPQPFSHQPARLRFASGRRQKARPFFVSCEQPFRQLDRQGDPEFPLSLPSRALPRAGHGFNGSRRPCCLHCNRCTCCKQSLKRRQRFSCEKRICEPISVRCGCMQCKITNGIA